MIGPHVKTTDELIRSASHPNNSRALLFADYLLPVNGVRLKIKPVSVPASHLSNIFIQTVEFVMKHSEIFHSMSLQKLVFSIEMIMEVTIFVC